MNKIKFKLIAQGDEKSDIWNTKVSHKGDILEVVAHVAEWVVRVLIVAWGLDKKSFLKKFGLLYDEVKLELKEMGDLDE